MDSLDWNRLAVATLISVGIFAGGWILGNTLIQASPPQKPAFLIKSTDSSPDFSIADSKHGQDVAAQQCGLCHTFEENGPSKIGPNLYEIIGHKIASRKDFHYSQALSARNKETWDQQKLYQWIKNPMEMVPGTTMAFAGVNDPSDRADIIAFLSKSSPVPPPKPPATTNAAPNTDTNLQEEGKVAAQKECAACHSFDPNGRNLIGPNLYNIVNKPIANKKNYPYSQALVSQKGLWSETNLDKWLENPSLWIPNNKMIYTGVSSPQTRKAIIIYLRSLAPK